jgi:glycosyltransferase involved in cell wall biosynthesis
LTQAGLNQAAAVVAPTIAFAAETARIYDINAPVVAVYNGRRAAFPTKLEQSDFVFTASRLWDEGKNVATLDAAAAQINFLFEAAGPMDGPNGASIALNHLHSLGEVSSARLQNILAARPIFASAAIYEPFGLSVLEAGLAGCALVLSDIPTYRELWGEAAVFVAARDDAAFATAIERLFEDPDERQRLGRLAQGRAQLYAPERMAGAMAEIYQRISRSHFTPVEIAGAA